MTTVRQKEKVDGHQPPDAHQSRPHQAHPQAQKNMQPPFILRPHKDFVRELFRCSPECQVGIRISLHPNVASIKEPPMYKTLFTFSTYEELPDGGIRLAVAIQDHRTCCSALLTRRLSGGRMCRVMHVTTCGWNVPAMLRSYAFLGALFGLASGSEPWRVTIKTKEVAQDSYDPPGHDDVTIQFSIARNVVEVHRSPSKATLVNEDGMPPGADASCAIMWSQRGQQHTYTSRCYGVAPHVESRERREPLHELSYPCEDLQVSHPQLLLTRIVLQCIFYNVFLDVMMAWQRSSDFSSVAPSALRTREMGGGVWCAPADTSRMVMTVAVNPARDVWDTLWTIERFYGVVTPPLHICFHLQHDEPLVQTISRVVVMRDGTLQVRVALGASPCCSAVLTRHRPCRDGGSRPIMTIAWCKAFDLLRLTNIYATIGVLIGMAKCGEPWVQVTNGRNESPAGVVAQFWGDSMDIYSDDADNRRTTITRYSPTPDHSCDALWASDERLVAPTSPFREVGGLTRAVAEAMLDGIVRKSPNEACRLRAPPKFALYASSPLL